MSIIMIETVIPFLAFLSVLAIGASFLLAQKQKQKLMEIRLQDSRFVEMPEKKEAKQLNFLKLLAQIGNVVSHGNASRTLNEQMVRAGYIGSAAPAIYTGVKILLFLLGLVIMTAVLMPTGLSDTNKTVLIVLAATIVFFLPNFIVVSQLKRRREEMRHHLPEAVDLLEICVSSGMGLDMAWHVVTCAFSKPKGLSASSTGT